jgi:cohesin complex subunit SA-1/2
MSLRINSALCDVADGVDKDFALKQRQREAEAKKKETGTAAQRKERAKEADKKVKAAHEQKTHIEGLMQETVDV